MKKIVFLGLLFLMSLNLVAQVTLPMPLNIQAAYNRHTRADDGKPGKLYWQNKAAYDISVQFSPETRLVSGREMIVYENNSPDTLKEIVFKLYPNIYKKGAPRLVNIAADDAGDGMAIESFTINGRQLTKKEYKIDATNMVVKIDPLISGDSLKLTIGYYYTLNKTSHIRTGEIEDGAYFLAYFFPRIAVYDDIDGWNLNPYLGTQEFYNDFCDFRLKLTAPADYVVWATGDLKNGQDIFKEKYQELIKLAETTNAVTNIIDSVDLIKGNITKGKTFNEWIFEARHVPDAVFALSNHYLWQSSSLVVDSVSGRRTRVDAVFNQRHKDYYHVISDARKTVEAMSYRFPKWPYPYNHITVFDGLDQMEYPMMVNDNPLESRAESIELTDHEIFHTMFPFYMGINETKYGWMDEGWATMGEWLISPMIDSTIVDEYGVARYEAVAGTEVDLPISTLTTQQSGITMFINSYPKPAMGYLFVKDMLGDELFFKGLHNYFNNWNGKHPIPWDFFNSMNAGAGINLNWFWKRWFFDSGVPDLAIAKTRLNRKRKLIIIESKGSMPLPINVTVEYEDGSIENIHRSIAVWEKGNKKVALKFVSGKKVNQIKLGSTYIPDIDKSNNIYNIKN